jgi:hypothetical protein
MSAQLIVTVHELILPSEALPADAVRKLSVHVEPADKTLVGGAVLQTQQCVLSERGSAHFGWSHAIDVIPGGRAWEALHRALASEGQEDSDIYFTVLDDRASLGEAYVNLEQMLTSGRDVVCEPLKVVGAGDAVIGRLTVTVQGIAAMHLVKSGAASDFVTPPPMATDETADREPAATGRAACLDKSTQSAPALPPAVTSSTYALQPGEVGTPVRLLGSAELRVILRRRGIHLPNRTEPHSFYVDACRSHHLFTVSPAELGDAQALVEAEAGRAAGVSSSSFQPLIHALVHTLSLPVMRIHVGELVLAGHYSRVSHGHLRIRVELAGMEGSKAVHTKAAPVEGSMQFDHSINVRHGTAVWDAVAGALASRDEAASDVFFTLVAAGASTSLGEGFISLRKDLLEKEHDLEAHPLAILDDHDSLVGHLRVSIHALSAMRAMQAPDAGCSAATQQAADLVSGELKVQVVVPACCIGGENATVRHEGADYDAALPAHARPGETVTVALSSVRAAAPTGGLTVQVSDHVVRRRHVRLQEAELQDSIEASAVGAASETLSRCRGRNLQPSMEELQSARGRVYTAQARAEQQAVKSREGNAERAAQIGLEAAERELAQARGEQVRSDRASAGGDEQLERDRAAKALQARIRARSKRDRPPARRHAALPHGRSGGTDRWTAGRPPMNPPPPDTSHGRGAVPHQAAPRSSGVATDVEHTLLVAFERLGDAKAQLKLAQQSRDNLEKYLDAGRREIDSLTHSLATSRAECAQQRALIAKRQLDRADSGVGVGHKARQVSHPPGGATVRSASAGAGTRAGQTRLLKLPDSTQSQIREMHRKLKAVQQAADTEQRLRQQAEHKAAESEQNVLVLLASMDIEAQRTREETAQRALLEETVSELRHELQQQAVMLEAEQEMRMALQSGEFKPVPRSRVTLDAHHGSGAAGALSPRRRLAAGASSSAGVVGSPRRSGDYPRRGTKQEHAAAFAIQRTWSKRSKAPRATLSSPMPNKRKSGASPARGGVARPAETGKPRGRTRQQSSPPHASMTDERRKTDTFSNSDSPLRVSRQGHKWTSDRERNMALRLQHMAEELAVAISEQDRMHAVTQRYLLHQDAR